MRAIVEIKTEKSSVTTKPCLKKHIESRASDERTKTMESKLPSEDDYNVLKGSNIALHRELTNDNMSVHLTQKVNELKERER